MFAGTAQRPFEVREKPDLTKNTRFFWSEIANLGIFSIIGGFWSVQVLLVRYPEVELRDSKVHPQNFEKIRFWLDCDLATTQTVAMVLCSTPKKQNRVVAQSTNRLAMIGSSCNKNWTICLVSNWLLNPE